MNKLNQKKSINITRRLDRSGAPIDRAAQATIVTHVPLRYPPKDKDEQNKLADELVAWCRLSDSLTINGYPISKGYNPYRFFKVSQKNEYFAEAVALSKAIIIDRLEKGIHFGKYDRAIFMARLPLYDPAYRAMQLENIKMQREVDLNQRAENFRIEIAAAESSDLVPVKVDDKNE